LGIIKFCSEGRYSNLNARSADLITNILHRFLNKIEDPVGNGRMILSKKGVRYPAGKYRFWLFAYYFLLLAVLKWFIW
jgi:hypothetical protein